MPIVALHACKDNYIWILVNREAHTMACVDPGDAEPVLFYAKAHQLNLTHIVLTHHHDDHIGGTSRLLQHYPDVQVYGPDDHRIKVPYHPIAPQHPLYIDGYTFQVFNIPGHTCSHICYYEPNQGWLFCGDTLFSAGCGRVFDGTIEELYQSIQLLKNLPDSTEVYCGHEYTQQNIRFAATIEPDNIIIKDYALYLKGHPTQCTLPSTIALEKKINPFFHALSLSDFKQLRAEKDGFTG